MNLMGHYAAANHALIHKHIAKKPARRWILDFENHHNFAWEENARRVYKDIHAVMAAQTDLVEVLGQFRSEACEDGPAGTAPRATTAEAGREPSRLQHHFQRSLFLAVTLAQSCDKQGKWADYGRIHIVPITA